MDVNSPSLVLLAVNLGGFSEREQGLEVQVLFVCVRAVAPRVNNRFYNSLEKREGALLLFVLLLLHWPFRFKGFDIIIYHLFSGNSCSLKKSMAFFSGSRSFLMMSKTASGSTSK